jgi:hypothetical protein
LYGPESNRGAIPFTYKACAHGSLPRQDSNL